MPVRHRTSRWRQLDPAYIAAEPGVLFLLFFVKVGSELLVTPRFRDGLLAVVGSSSHGCPLSPACLAAELGMFVCDLC